MASTVSFTYTQGGYPANTGGGGGGCATGVDMIPETPLPAASPCTLQTRPIAAIVKTTHSFTPTTRQTMAGGSIPTTIAMASSACSAGPSEINCHTASAHGERVEGREVVGSGMRNKVGIASSWTCRIMTQPISRKRLWLFSLIIAAATTSAAPPYSSFGATASPLKTEKEKEVKENAVPGLAC